MLGSGAKPGCLYDPLRTNKQQQALAANAEDVNFGGGISPRTLLINPPQRKNMLLPLNTNILVHDGSWV